jgi:hypothetical protein
MKTINHKLYILKLNIELTVEAIVEHLTRKS